MTYKDPDSGPKGKTKHGLKLGLKLGQGVDLTKIFVKAVRELGENGGSNLRTIEKFISNSYDVEGETECDLHDLLRVAAKKSLNRGLVIHNSETSAFKAVAGRKGTKNKEKKEERERERREKKERRRERKEKKLRKLQHQKNVSSSTEESPKVGITFTFLNQLWQMYVIYTDQS